MGLGSDHEISICAQYTTVSEVIPYDQGNRFVDATLVSVYNPKA